MSAADGEVSTMTVILKASLSVTGEEELQEGDN